jgi:hypothetical protein
MIASIKERKPIYAKKHTRVILVQARLRAFEVTL